MHPLHEQFAPARRVMADQLGATAARFLLERMAARELSDGTTLLTQGARSDSLFFVLGGALGIWVGEGERALLVSEILPGQWVGEVTFVDPGPASASATARGETLVLELRNRDIGVLTDDAPEVVTQLLHQLSVALAERVVHAGAGRIERKGENLRLASRTAASKQGWFARVFGRRGAE